MIKRHEQYCELGADYFNQHRPETTAKRLIYRLEHLGYQVALHQLSVTDSL